MKKIYIVESQLWQIIHNIFSMQFFNLLNQSIFTNIHPYKSIVLCVHTLTWYVKVEALLQILTQAIHLKDFNHQRGHDKYHQPMGMIKLLWSMSRVLLLIHISLGPITLIWFNCQLSSLFVVVFYRMEHQTIVYVSFDLIEF